MRPPPGPSARRARRPPGGRAVTCPRPPRGERRAGSGPGNQRRGVKVCAKGYPIGLIPRQ